MMKKKVVTRVNWKRRASWLESELSETRKDWIKRLIGAERQTVRVLVVSSLVFVFCIFSFLMVLNRLGDSREQVELLSFYLNTDVVSDNYLMGELNSCRSDLMEMTSAYVFEKNSPPMFVNECCFPAECGVVALSNPAICKCEFVGFCG
jgi:hypothetical protein